MRTPGILAALSIVWLLAPAMALAADVLNGRYFGVEDASGASIQITPDGQGFSGTFFDPFGQRQDFDADKVGDTAEAVLDMDDRAVLLRLAPLPYGAEAALIPFASDGRLDVSAARVLNFVREGLQLPELPPDFVEAPRSSIDRIAGNSFLQSYQFWEPAGVANGYLALPDRFRTLLRMFPSVQLDVIWKLCLAPGADAALGLALRGQGLDCAQVLDGIARTQRSNTFTGYKTRVERERQSLRMSVRCADGYVESKADCEAAARTLSERAISMRTAGMVLRELR
ncbi:MAG: hypothetical protein AB8B85_03880 [Paracoccaceae bacterium]